MTNFVISDIVVLDLIKGGHNMPIVKDIAKVAEKWARVTPQRAADYEAGVGSY